MSERNNLGFVLPSIVAGMLIAFATMEFSNSVASSPLKALFPPQMLVLVALAIAAASVVGLVSTLVSRRKDESSSKANAVRKGDHHV
jgi:hypothetical protein